jgi:hypothetical protein
MRVVRHAGRARAALLASSLDWLPGDNSALSRRFQRELIVMLWYDLFRRRDYLCSRRIAKSGGSYALYGLAKLPARVPAADQP